MLFIYRMHALIGVEEKTCLGLCVNHEQFQNILFFGLQRMWHPLDTLGKVFC